MLGVILTVLALLLVAGINLKSLKPALTARNVWFGVIMMLSSGYLTLIGLSSYLSARGYLPDSDIGGLVKTYKELIAAHTPDKLLIVADGGSMAARGLDGELVSGRLEEQGIPNTFIQFTLMGANHTERDFLNELFLEKLSEEERAKITASKTLFLLEAYTGYSQNPLAKAHENAKAKRVLDYLSPERAQLGHDSILVDQEKMIRAVGPFTPVEIRKNREIPAERKWAIGLREMQQFLAETSMSNLLRVGILFRRESYEEVRPVKGFRPIKAQREFEYMPTSEVLALFEARPSGKEFALAQLVETRAPWFINQWKPAEESRVIYFSTPTLLEEEVAHLLDACAAAGEANCIRYDDPGLMLSLDDKMYWRDGLHLTRDGAPIFSEWFAGALAANILEADK